MSAPSTNGVGSIKSDNLELSNVDLTNEFANLMKLSTLASTIAVYELLQESNNLIASTYRPLEIYTFLAIVFFAVTFPWIWLSRRLERRLQRMS